MKLKKTRNVRNLTKCQICAVTVTYTCHKRCVNTVLMHIYETCLKSECWLWEWPSVQDVWKLLPAHHKRCACTISRTLRNVKILLSIYTHKLYEFHCCLILIVDYFDFIWNDQFTYTHTLNHNTRLLTIYSQYTTNTSRTSFFIHTSFIF